MTPSYRTIGHVLDTYGPLIRFGDLCRIVGVATGTGYNMISAGRFPIPTSRGVTGREAHYMDVARYIDAKDAATNLLQQADDTRENAA